MLVEYFIRIDIHLLAPRKGLIYLKMQMTGKNEDGFQKQ